MTRHHPTTALPIAVFAALVSGCAHDRPVATANDHASAVLPVPDALKAPDNQVLTVAARGAGYQVYVCQPGKSDAALFAWT